MASDLTATFGKPFAEAVAAFRLRLGNPVPTARWDDLWQAQHDRAFMVAGAMKADLLSDLAQAVDKAIAKGTSLEEFRRDFRRIVEERGWHGWTGEETKAGQAWRTRVIYRTNMATAYASGRRAQLVEAGYPFWVYRHGGSVEPRILHLGWDGLVLPAGHPFWATHAPPNGWGCRCYVIGARSDRGAVRVGGQPGKTLPEGWQKLDPKSGAPKGIDKGWAYAPGATVVDTVRLAARKVEDMPAILGADYAAAISGLFEKHWPAWLADTIVKGSHEPAIAGALSRELVEALEKRGLAAASAEIYVRPGLVAGPKAVRHERGGDGLSPADWIALPKMLRKPSAVLLDTKSHALVFLLPAGDGDVQLALDLQYRQRRHGETISASTVKSAYRAPMSEIRARIKAGLLVILTGSVG